MRRFLPLLLLPLLACTSPAPLPAGATAVSLHPLVQGEGTSTRVVETGESLCCLAPSLLDQQHITSVEVLKGELGTPEIRLHLDDHAARAFSDHASTHVGQRVAVVVGDDLRVAPLLLPDFETRWLTLAVRQPSGALAAAEEMAAKIRSGIGKTSPAP